MYKALIVFLTAAAATFKDAKNPLSLSIDELSKSLNVNTTSAYAAVQQAVRGFEQLPDSSSRTFIYTGNILNITVMPALLDLGVGKSATSHIIQAAATVYSDRGFKYVFPYPSAEVGCTICVTFRAHLVFVFQLTDSRFYYADERNADGTPPYSKIDGEAHGQFYAELAESKVQGEWQQTFAKGVGYKKF